MMLFKKREGGKLSPKEDAILDEIVEMIESGEVSLWEVIETFKKIEKKQRKENLNGNHSNT